MAFGRRRGGSVSVHSVKHVLDSGGGLTDVTSSVPISQVVNARAAVFDPVEVVLGETIKYIFLIINIIGATGAGVTGPVDWYIAKQRSGQSVGVFPDPGNTGQSNLRNQIFHEEKGVPGSADGTPHVFKGVIKVPPIYQRQRDSDQFVIRLKMSTGDTGVFCVKAIYKSWS